MDKTTMRATLTAGRRARTAAESDEARAQRGARIATECLKVAELAAACEQGAVVASYVSVQSEPPTTDLNDALVVAGALVVVPQHEVNGRLLEGMEWLDLKTGKIVAATPAVLIDLQVSVIVTPALAVGRDGSRLGKGKGYYDKLFAQLPRWPAGPLRLALASPDEVFDTLPTDEFDQPVDRFVTG